ncbi:MAG: ribonuclease III [Acidobacteriota bacterium]
MQKDLEEKLGYKFRNKDLVNEALTHSSFNEGKKKDKITDNERLEFLGDSVINLVITDFLFRKYKRLKEGELSKLKAHLVSSTFLFDLAMSIDLHTHIFLGKGEEKNGGRENIRIIASLFESVAGAIYLDSNFKTASSVLIKFFREFLEKHIEKAVKINDYKSEFQELIQKQGLPLPYYNLIKESGKPPNVTFISAVLIDKKEMGRGTGKNKRQSEQNAAFNALEKSTEFINYEKLSEIFFIKND